MDRFIVIVSLALVVVVFGLIGAVSFGIPAATTESQYTADNALTTARQFASAENTFKFDGMADMLTVRLNRTISDDAYEVIADFTSRHAGFGDRTGMMMAEVITSHNAIITVEKGTVTSAIMDGQYDMKTQKMIEANAPMMPALDPANTTKGTTPEGMQL